MSAEAELSLAVVSELRSLSPGDSADFFRQLHKVRQHPLKHSRVFYDQQVSGYLLRFFPFGVGVERIAVFVYDGKTVRVIRCRLSKPRRRRDPEKPVDRES